MADCSKTVDFVKERERMCDTYDGCDGCSFESGNNGYGYQCEDYVNICTKEAIQALQKWSDEHPEPKPKTYADVFFERNPKAFRNSTGYPELCRDLVFDGMQRTVRCDSPMSCLSCWDEPYPEQEESK